MQPRILTLAAAACAAVFMGPAAGALAQTTPAPAATVRPVTPATPPAVQLAAPPAPGFFLFSDTSIGYRYGTEFKEPAVRNRNSPNGIQITKNIISITHADAYKYGSNFFNLDYLISDHNDPARASRAGAQELYFVYRTQVSPDEILGTKIFPNAFIRDVTFEAGFDRNTKNTTFASQKWLVVAGPNIHFNVPGFLNVGLHYAQEWNHNGVVGRGVHFNPTFEIEAVYSFPLAFTKLPLRLEGFTNLVTPKGKDGFGVETQLEILSQTRLTLDFGAVAFNKPSFLDLSVGFQYWYNKFGNDHTKTKGSIEYAPFLATRVHF